jgi:hypothetical protein
MNQVRMPTIKHFECFRTFASDRKNQWIEMQVGRIVQRDFLENHETQSFHHPVKSNNRHERCPWFLPLLIQELMPLGKPNCTPNWMQLPFRHESFDVISQIHSQES